MLVDTRNQTTTTVFIMKAIVMVIMIAVVYSKKLSLPLINDTDHENQQNSRLLQPNNSPWHISRIGDVTAAFSDGDDGEATILYEIAKDKAETAGSVRVTLLEFDCVTEKPANSVEVKSASVDNFQTPSDIENLRVYKVEVNILEATIMGTSLWVANADTTEYDGSVQFCVLVELLNPGGNAVTFKETKVIINTKLSSDFTIASFSTNPADEDLAETSAAVTYQMQACRCNESNECAIPEGEKVKVNSAVRLCIKSTSTEVSVKNIVSLDLKQNGELVRSPIENGDTEIGGITDASIDAGVGIIVTQLTRDFFRGNNPGDISADGIVELNFTPNRRRHHQQRRILQTNVEKQGDEQLGRFSVNIPLEPLDEEESNSISINNTFFSATAFFAFVIMILL